MADIGGDSRGVGDIEEGEAGDERVEFHEESKRLTDSTGGAEDGDFTLGDGGGGEGGAAEKRLLRR